MRKQLHRSAKSRSAVPSTHARRESRQVAPARPSRDYLDSLSWMRMKLADTYFDIESTISSEVGRSQPGIVAARHRSRMLSDARSSCCLPSGIWLKCVQYRCSTRMVTAVKSFRKSFRIFCVGSCFGTQDSRTLYWLNRRRPVNEGWSLALNLSAPANVMTETVSSKGARRIILSK
jgi:hypothetical protein